MEKWFQRRYSKCQGPEVGACVACVGHIKKACVAGVVSEGKKVDEFRTANSREWGEAL